MILNLRTLSFRAAVEHDLSFYDQFSSGRIASRINSDTNDLGNLVVIITDVSAQIFQAILLGIVIVRTEWHLALLLFAFLPFIFGLALGFRSLARRVTKSGMQAMADVNSAIKETVSGIAIAKNFRQENSIFETFNAANRTSYRVNVWRGFILSLVWPSPEYRGGIGTAVLVYRRRAERRAGCRHHRRLVPVHPEPGSLLRSGHEPFGFLVQHSVRLERGRAHLRPDGCRAECGPDRQPGCPAL